MKPKIRKGIKGIKRFLAQECWKENWHIFTRTNENDEYLYTTFYGLTAKQAIDYYTRMGWTFDNFNGDALYFTENY